MIPYLQKDAQGQNNRYTRLSSILGSIIGKMNELKIHLFPVIKELTRDTYVYNKVEKKGNQEFQKSTVRHVISGQLCYIFQNALNPEEKEEVPWWTFGQNNNDPAQAFGSGLTFSKRYFLCDYFNIAMDDLDPDKFKEEFDILTEQQKEEEIEQKLTLVKELEDKLQTFKDVKKLTENYKSIEIEFISKGMTDKEVQAMINSRNKFLLKEGKK